MDGSKPKEERKSTEGSQAKSETTKEPNT